MTHPLDSIGPRWRTWPVWVTLAALAVALAGRATMPWPTMFPDVLCYWTAGRLVAEGKSPYDPAAQARIQAEQGWQRDRQGRGVLDYLPFYYPPWFALACVPLGWLDLDDAKLAWFFLNTWLLLAAGALLRECVPRVPGRVPVGIVPLFLPSVLALTLGQTTPIILVLAVLGWRSWERGRDLAAGAALAGLTTKPQLAAVVVLGMLLAALRRRRPRMIVGFLLTLAGLAALGWWVVPWWPQAMLAAARRDPPPTQAFPWIGGSWLLALRSLGLRSWPLAAIYLAAALPLLAATVAAALDRSRPARDAFALGVIATFFVTPYTRHYDYPLLLIPALMLLDGRLSELAGAGLVVALGMLPYLQFVLMVRFYTPQGPIGFYPEVTYFWIPATLALVWVLARWPVPPDQVGEPPP